MEPAAEKFERRTFDESERERIRAALRRYKDEQNLSMSRLSYRIAEANGRKRGMISRRTLERFLNEKFRVIFLRAGEPPPPYEIMGDAVVSFFDRAPVAPQARKAHGAMVAAMFARRYRCYLRGERTKLASDEPFDDPSWPVPARTSVEPAYEIPYAVLDLEPLAGTAYIKVTEHVVNPKRSSHWGRVVSIGAKLSAASEAHNYLGVLALCAGTRCASPLHPPGSRLTRSDFVNRSAVDGIEPSSADGSVSSLHHDQRAFAPFGIQTRAFAPLGHDRCIRHRLRPRENSALPVEPIDQRFGAGRRPTHSPLDHDQGGVLGCALVKGDGWQRHRKKAAAPRAQGPSYG